jgi:hypothetical protein
MIMLATNCTATNQSQKLGDKYIPNFDWGILIAGSGESLLGGKDSK